MVILSATIAITGVPASARKVAPPHALAELPCTIFAGHHGVTLDRLANCAYFDEKHALHIDWKRLARAHPEYDRVTGLVAIAVDQWYYVIRNTEKLVAVMTYDNGPDWFSNDRARSPDGKKIGYIDQKLNSVIPAIFDGAFPFNNRKAVVCNGCSVKTDGEHASYVGGQWACIDIKGRLIIPFSKDAAQTIFDRCR
jgi:hypothetical protein